jgi:hypothetical protein
VGGCDRPKAEVRCQDLIGANLNQAPHDLRRLRVTVEPSELREWAWR